MPFLNSDVYPKFHEDVPMQNLGQNDADDAQASTSNEAVRRSSSNAYLSEYRPQMRVRFNSLAAGINKRISDAGTDLLSPKAHQIGLSTALRSGGWQDTILRRRRQGLSPHSEVEELQEIAHAMVEDEQLMADDIDGARLRKDAVRKLTKPLSVRKELLRQLTVSRTSNARAHKRLSIFKSIKYSCSIKWYKMKEFVKITLRNFSLWEKDLKSIEGIFGSSVGSYFRFLRYLFLLNSFVALLVLIFLFLPQMLLSNPPKDSANTSSKDNMNSFTFGYGNISQTRPNFNILDVFTGSGWFGGTKLYYGGYSSGLLYFPHSSLPYNIPQAYFFTIYSCFILYTVVLLYRIVVLYRANYIDAEEDPTLVFVNKIYLAWDFNITDEQAAIIKRKSIYNELVEIVEEFLSGKKIESVLKFLQRRTIQFLSWFVVVGFLLLLCWGLYLLLKDQLLSLHEEKFVYRGHLMAYPLIVTFLMAILPKVFENAGKLEIYHRPRYELYVNVTRVILLGVIVLLALIIFWYENSPGLRDELDSGMKQVLLSSYHDNLISGVNSSAKNSTQIQCWENGLGQEIYRLVIVDFIVILISTLCIDGLKVVLARRGNIRKSSLTFSIPRNTLHVIYNQMLLWAGFFFCPLLPLIVAIKFFIMFQVQKFTVLRNVQPLERPWRAAQTETLFQALNLLCLILAIFSNGFIVIRGYSSLSCGPFQGFIHYLDIVWNAVENSERTVLKIVAFFLRPGFMFGFLVFLCLVVYCFKTISEGRLMLVSVLRKQLQLEMKDRAFLLGLIERVNKGEDVTRVNHLDDSVISFGASEVKDANRTKRSSFVFSKTGLFDSRDNQ